MKILIDIQEETYNKMRRGEALYPADANVAIFAIETGTPLEECDDCISRRAVLERAINAPIAKVVTEDKVIYRKIIFADDVEKLSPVTPQPCDDAISRQAAIDACLNGWNKDYKEIVEEIRALPPVKPQYTDAEIQKMQDLESAEIQKAYEIGKEEGREVLDKIRKEIKQAADKQFQIAIGVADLNERHTHIQMENAYRHSLNIIDKYKAEGSDKE